MAKFTGPDDPWYIAFLDEEMERKAEQQRQELIWKTHVGKVLDNLFIGDRYIAYDEAWLTEYEIEVVVNCTAELPYNSLVPQYFNLPLEDGEDLPNLEVRLRQLALELAKYKDKKNILIHCSAGVSRSATVTITYLMLVLGLTYREALVELKAKWPQANPDAIYRKYLEQL